MRLVAATRPRTKTASFQTGVPAQFAQTYSQSGSPKVGYYRPDQQATRQTTDPYGWSPAVATAPDGSIVQVWYQGRSIGDNRYVNELYYAVLDNLGNVIRPATRITDLGAASTSAYDYDPAVAVAAGRANRDRLAPLSMEQQQQHLELQHLLHGAGCQRRDRPIAHQPNRQWELG